jgi:hypothetical protein
MSAADILSLAQKDGIDIILSGADLVLEADHEPAPALLDAIRHHKSNIVALLSKHDNAWTSDEWRSYFTEQAGIAEFDGRLPRPEAEAGAFDCCVAEWLNRDHVRSAPSRCLGCGEGEQVHEPLLPFGTETVGHTWLHHRCWSAWHEVRHAQAVAALVAQGIERRSIRP